MDSTVTISGLGVLALVGVGFVIAAAVCIRENGADELDVPLRRDVAIPRNVGHADRRSEPMAEGDSFVCKRCGAKTDLCEMRGALSDGVPSVPGVK
jgi:hypothetical protein